MNNMSVTLSLQERIARLMSDATVVARNGATQTEAEMDQLLPSMDRFEALAKALLSDVLLPRLRTLALAFPNSSGPRPSASSDKVSVVFARTDDFPVDARFEVGIAHDRKRDCAVVTTQASIIPILMDYDRERSVELNLGNPEPGALESFLDDRVVRFVSDYLRVRDPESPYQQGLTVTDPVCGMTLHRAGAAGSLEWNGRRYYFCVDRCRERFEADPGRYLTATRRPVGTGQQEGGKS